MPLFQRESTEVEPKLACPHDSAELEKLAVDGVTVDRCRACGGTWFDHHELRRVAHDREVEALASRIPRVQVVSPFWCPRCGAQCVEAHVSEVEVDTCVKCHGVWLDRGELEEAKRLVAIERTMRAAGPGFRAFLTRL